MKSPTLAVGTGFDIHRFSDNADRMLVLGGVEFPGERGLEGHSDADVVAHAIMDAMLGAAGLGDIGEQFPDTDSQWENHSSTHLLSLVNALLVENDWEVSNLDCSVVLEHPKLASLKEEMQNRLSAIVNAPVSVKAKTAEALGAVGRQEGIACWAVALVARRD